MSDSNSTDGEQTVSVVIPTYYRNDRLRDAVRSVLRQDYTALECIVVDSSAEGIAQRVTSEFEGVTYVHQERYNGIHGAAGARDIGIGESSGSLVRFLDDDDRLRTPDALSKQVERISASEGVGVVYCGIQWEDGPQVAPDPAVRGDVLARALMLQTAPCLPSTMLVEKSVLKEIPALRSLPHDDAGMTIEFARETEFDYVDEPLVLRGNEEDSLGGSKSSLDGRKRLIEEYAELYETFPLEVHNTALGRVYLQEGQFHLTQRVWSLRAIVALSLAAYRFPGINVPAIGAVISAVFGRPGWTLGLNVYSRVFCGGKRRGNMNTIRV